MYRYIFSVILTIFIYNNVPLNCSAQNSKDKYVDLDLPSGTLWGVCNVGASSPYEYGSYYSWGETQEKRYYTYYASSKFINIIFKGNGELEDNPSVTKILKYHKGDSKTNLDAEDDIANLKLGDGWSIPTRTQMCELLDTRNCRWEPVIENGTKGFRVISKRDSSHYIFLPLAGFKMASDGKASIRQNCTTEGYYWTATLNHKNPEWADALYMRKTELRNDAGVFFIDSCYRANGLVVRPVYRIDKKK